MKPILSILLRDALEDLLDRYACDCATLSLGMTTASCADTMVASRDFPADGSFVRLNAAHNLAFSVYSSGRAVRVANNGAQQCCLMAAEELCSFVGVPVHAQDGDNIGTLACYAATPRLWSDHEVQRLTQDAAAISPAAMIWTQARDTANTAKVALKIAPTP